MKREVAEARFTAKRSQRCSAGSESSQHCWQGPAKWPEPSAKEQEGSLGQLLHNRGRSTWMAVTSLDIMNHTTMSCDKDILVGMPANNFFLLWGAVRVNAHTTCFLLFLHGKKNTHTHTHSAHHTFFLNKHDIQLLKPNTDLLREYNHSKQWHWILQYHDRIDKHNHYLMTKTWVISKYFHMKLHNNAHQK